ncbi:carboxylesterase/lipase family protein [Agromyces atrinae]|uniref:Carboxylic ester hydrolase n=1 Tax=Agromyces atrinae TaxID=592376 RepID=A0A4Q2M7G9_9MICO|nr:carboxylesterase family protein [Agromyces atrinae]NYD67596.1 para-nitrobenzyl esterase [Agromyces atrinae]RXZ88194.1 carboxylesterase/lipase family protein [Agromyces atrinae]
MSAPVAQTRSGAVRGVWRDDAGGRSAAFLGIPFAAAPVGELRFAAPAPHPAWEGERDATEFGATPFRDDGTGGVTLIPEPGIVGDSTLNVNVFTPDPDAAGLPVLVYIHGGGYVSGSPSSSWYDGAAFNRDGIVTVSVSYRLGFDGFGWIEDAPHNRAVLDWIAALEWVQGNIADFGGDPERVTIAGQSAGGGAVLTLLGVPRARGLFHRAISMSGVLSATPLGRAEELGRRLAAELGVEPTRAALAALPEERVLAAQKAVEPKLTAHPLAAVRQMIGDGVPWSPVIDGDLVPHAPLDAAAAGASADVPLIVSSVDDEFSMATDRLQGALRLIPASAGLGLLGLARDIRRPYLAANVDVHAKGTAAMLGRYVSDAVFRSAALAFTRARGDAPTWLARFTWPSPAFAGRAVHCLDVPFFFDCLGAERIAHLAGDAPPQSLADALHGSAVAFISGGDPGWERWDAASEPTRLWEVPPTVAPHAYASVEPLLG